MVMTDEVAPSAASEPKKPASRAPSRRTRSTRGRTSARGTLPALVAVASRPLWLIVGALLGAGLGAATVTGAGYSAETVLSLTDIGSDAVRAKQIGQTVERLATSGPILDSAQAAMGPAGQDLTDRVEANWLLDTDLVSVHVTAGSPEQAVAEANAVAAAVAGESDADIAARLAALRTEANRLLASETLDDPDAEAARRSQLGNALASRQDQIASSTGSIVVSDPAEEAVPAGLSRTMGGLLGLVGGLLLGALVAALLGVTGLRLRNERALRLLLPELKISSANHPAEIAGAFIESGKSCLAVIAMPGALDDATQLAANVAEWLRAHGSRVAVVDATVLSNPDQRRLLLGHDGRTNVQETLGADLLLAVVGAYDHASAMLMGQGNLRALLVAPRRTRIKALVAVAVNFEPAKPVLIPTQ